MNHHTQESAVRAIDEFISLASRNPKFVTPSLSKRFIQAVNELHPECIRDNEPASFFDDSNPRADMVLFFYLGGLAYIVALIITRGFFA